MDLLPIRDLQFSNASLYRRAHCQVVVLFLADYCVGAYCVGTEGKILSITRRSTPPLVKSTGLLVCRHRVDQVGVECHRFAISGGWRAMSAFRSVLRLQSRAHAMTCWRS